MNPVRRLSEYLNDPNRSYEERTLIMMALLGECALIFALVFDILGGENIVEIITLIAMTLAVPVVTAISVRTQRISTGAFIQVCALVFIILPVIFFYGGGPEGGGVFWIIFSYMFVGMSLSGGLRIFMMVCLSFIAMGEYLVWYLCPGMIEPHTTRMFFIDTLVSLLLVGLGIYVMFMYQKSIYKEQRDRAMAEADRAEELNRSQNRFFSSMSHEIRTPINSILGLNEVILRSDDASEEIMRDAENIQGAGKMLLSLIDDILDFSKIEAGSMDIVPVDYKVGDMMSEIVNMIWLRATEKGLSFDVDIDPNVPSVLFGDEMRIKQIAVNLLNNAVKYTETGSVGLRVEAEKENDKQIKLIISVSDTGIGIRQEQLPYLFDAFKRIDQEKNRYIEGSGLGLAIVKQLVELMEGDISVNSVYGQGSTFTVNILQEVSDSKKLGNINITNRGSDRQKYEHMFTASDARILIVDDNEMNLEVESKLLDGTGLMVNTVMSGAQALAATLEKRYDVILMDHLMPEMDGIECLEQIRKQSGGLNTDVPVVVLTANAIAKNKELYSASGFDGYLVKPVSGRQLEEMLIKFIPREKMLLSRSLQMNAVEMNTAQGYSRKLPVTFAACSLSDIPEVLQKKLGIAILPYNIVTDEGVFRDNVEMSAGETVRYMDSGRMVESRPPSVSEYVDFFGKLLKKAHHVIYVAVTTSMTEDCLRAQEAARSFENVTVINSGCMTSALAFMIMCGYKMAQKNTQVDKIVAELNALKNRLHSSFLMGTTEYMARKGLVSGKVNKMTTALDLRPALEYRGDEYKVKGVWLGSARRCYEGYIKKALPRSAKPDTELIFVAYAAVPEDDLVWIEEQIRKRADFEYIIFQQASAAVTSNCGPGTFGLMYMDKGESSYGLSSLLPDDFSGMDDEREDELIDAARKQDEEAMLAAAAAAEDVKWYECIDGINGAIAFKNSGSEDSVRTLLKLFYDAIENRAAEIERYYEEKDWENYTIKVHALKSSARLIGAMELGDEAQRLEDAGKVEDERFIDAKHAPMIKRYRGYIDALGSIFEEEEEDKPMANAQLMERTYSRMLEAAKHMDYDELEGIYSDMERYSIPAEEVVLYSKLKVAFEAFDYDAIVNALNDRVRVSQEN